MNAVLVGKKKKDEEEVVFLVPRLMIHQLPLPGEV